LGKCANGWSGAGDYSCPGAVYYLSKTDCEELVNFGIKGIGGNIFQVFKMSWNVKINKPFA
jgi:hypothetical protein